MKIDPQLHQLLNQQIKNEMDSSHAYLAMSAWFENTPYAGFAQWMYAQSLEETDHAMRFFRYLADRDTKIELQPLECPAQNFASPREVFEQSLAQEQRVTEQIHGLYDKAVEVRDHATQNFLNWFLDEQVEEEKTVRDMIDRIILVEKDPAGLLQLDAEAAQRKQVTDQSQ